MSVVKVPGAILTVSAVVRPRINQATRSIRDRTVNSVMPTVNRFPLQSRTIPSAAR